MYFAWSIFKGHRSCNALQTEWRRYGDIWRRGSTDEEIAAACCALHIEEQCFSDRFSQAVHLQIFHVPAMITLGFHLFDVAEVFDAIGFGVRGLCMDVRLNLICPYAQRHDSSVPHHTR